MGNDALSVLHFCLFVAARCLITSNLPQHAVWIRTRFVRQTDFYGFYDDLISFLGDPDSPHRIAFNQICDGRVSVQLGACNNAYVRCSYDSSGHYVATTIEECPLGKIFNGASCEVVRDNCLGTWTKQMETMNTETERLLLEMNFCQRGPGIFMLLTDICSRQAYVCIQENQGFAIKCPPGMVMLWRPFGCFVYPSHCAPGRISMEKFAPLRQYAIHQHCANEQTVEKKDEMGISPRLQCITWYVDCRKSIRDIVYCDSGMIYGKSLGKCRTRKPSDRCVMPDICRNRDWETVSLGDCNRHFIYCRGRVPEEFVCAEQFVFHAGRCIPADHPGSRCWKCRDGEKRHTLFHSCSEYSVCKNGRWKEQSCSPGMRYFEEGEVCQPDPSCALPAKCKVGKSYHLKCNEYMICTWKGVFERRVCPPFHQWNIKAGKCLPDSNCSLSPEKVCREGEIIDSFDCEFYHQCNAGKWIRKRCPKYSVGECMKCQDGGSTNWRTEVLCREGDIMADPQDCTSYAICNGGVWRSNRCRRGLFWNQQLRRCDLNSDCMAFKRADCIHGQRLVGETCSEYLECIHGSWITMQCLRGYAFDIVSKQCVASQKCSPSHNDYLSLVDHNIGSPSPIFEPLLNFDGGISSSTLAMSSEELRRNCRFGSSIADENDCSKYYECTSEGYRARYCEANYQFNDESGQCEKNYRCDLWHCTEGRAVERRICGHYRICQKGEWHNAACENNRRFAEGRCQTAACEDEENEKMPEAPCRKEDILADEADCTRYFVCKNDRFREHLCRNGTFFDKKRGYCTRDSSCKRRCSEGELAAHKSDCTAYEFCNGGEFELRFCPYGLIYNHSNRACEEGSCAGGTRHDTCQESGGTYGYRADPLDCNKFYQCAQGKWVPKKCPVNLFWNSERSTCDWPQNVELCRQRNGVPN